MPPCKPIIAEPKQRVALGHAIPVVFAALLGSPLAVSEAENRSGERLRIVIETDAGGDPDDEQSLVRFLLYTNEWDVEGIIVTRAEARDGENLNPERTGLGIVRRQLQAYRECYPSLRLHDRRYPSPDLLWRRTVPSYGGTDEAERLILEAVDRPDPRPVWFCNWGTDEGSEGSSLKRVLDRVLKERGPTGYARFKRRLRLSSDDQFGEHTKSREPPFPLWVDTFRPERDRRRWYHRFSALTATAGGFDVRRDVLTGHGPLGALYPTNTTHPQKEGDTMTFLYLVPTGMNDPEHPGWGSWAGRYGPNERWPGRPYYWANQEDTWNGTTSRDNTVARWAAALQNDFRARLDWCVRDYAHANHLPRPRVRGSLVRTVRSGEGVRLDASASDDPDRNPLRLEWSFYSEAGSYRGALPTLQEAGAGKCSFTAPEVEQPAVLHVLLMATDSGSPPLTRYRRVVVKVLPRSRGQK
jgi:hypothetical protein